MKFVKQPSWHVARVCGESADDNVRMRAIRTNARGKRDKLIEFAVSEVVVFIR